MRATRVMLRSSNPLSIWARGLSKHRIDPPLHSMECRRRVEKVRSAAGRSALRRYAVVQSYCFSKDHIVTLQAAETSAPGTHGTFCRCQCQIDGVFSGLEAFGARGRVCLISGFGGLCVEGARTPSEAEIVGVTGGAQLSGVLEGSPGLCSSEISSNGLGGVTVGPINLQLEAGSAGELWIESVWQMATPEHNARVKIKIEPRKQLLFIAHLR